MCFSLRDIRSRVARLIYATAFICFALPLASFAQQAQVSGIVTDPSSAPVTGATVTLHSVATNTDVTTATNHDGLYRFTLSGSGTYRITVSATGFEQAVIDNLKLEVAGKVTQDVQLKIGQVTETMSVSANTIQVNTVDSAVSTVVNRQFVENMPLNGRSFQSLLTVVPGVNVVVSTRGQGQSGEMSVNGQRTESNYFMVDGVGANTGAYPSTPGWGAGYSGSTPSQTALGTTQSMVSIDALEEFRAITSTYSAEYGRAPGGQFSFTSRAGTNDVHGSLFEYFRNDVLDANNWFSNATATEKPKQRQNDFGGTFGGPVYLPKLYDGRNRTFFFFSYEGLRLRSPQPAVVTDVPTVALRETAPKELQPFVKAFPLPNGPEVGNQLATFTSSFSNPGTLNSTSIRADHHVTETFRIFGRYSQSPSDNRGRSASDLSRITLQESNGKTLTIGATNTFSARLSNDARFNFSRHRQGQVYTMDGFGGAQPLDISTIPGYSNSNMQWVDFYMYWGLRPSFALNSKRNQQDQINITDSLSLFLGSHHLKFGVDFRQLATKQPAPQYYQFAIFNTLDELMTNRPSNVTMERFTGDVNPVYKNFSAFIQDEWRVNSRLSLSLGLRWDVNPAPTDSDGHLPYNADQLDDLTKTALALHDEPLFATRWSNIAPRVGLAYVAHASNDFETVLRLGGGMFYDTANSTASMGYFGVGRVGALRYLNQTSSFPVDPSQFDLLKPEDTSTPYNFTLYAIDRNLKSPYSLQWSAAVEQGIGRNQTFTATYIGSASRQLPVAWQANSAWLAANNPNFTTWGLGYTKNGANASYNALQLQYQRRLSAGLQATVSHTWAHAIDDATNNFTTTKLLRASSDYDIRQNFQAAVTYLVPGSYRNALASALLKGWALDSRFVARTGLPIDIQGTTAVDPTTGISVSFQPDYVGGADLYVYDANLPGGRRINFNAFKTAAAGVQGNAGRNLARGFGITQLDMSVRRNFSLGERAGLEFRAEAFNIFNHPMFGAIYNQLSVGAARFGLAYNMQNTQLGGLNSLYQSGGPRSMQFALRLRF